LTQEDSMLVSYSEGGNSRSARLQGLNDLVWQAMAKVDIPALKGAVRPA